MVRLAISSAAMWLVAFPVSGGEIIGHVRTAIDRSGLQVAEMFVERGRLEDVFRDLTIGAPVTDGNEETPDG